MDIDTRSPNADERRLSELMAALKAEELPELADLNDKQLEVLIGTAQTVRGMWVRVGRYQRRDERFMEKLPAYFDYIGKTTEWHLHTKAGESTWGIWAPTPQLAIAFYLNDHPNAVWGPGDGIWALQKATPKETA